MCPNRIHLTVHPFESGEMIGKNYDEIMVGSLWRALGIQSVSHLTGLMDWYLPDDYNRFCRSDHLRER
jgi:hypothetical protein